MRNRKSDKVSFQFMFHKKKISSSLCTKSFLLFLFIFLLSHRRRTPFQFFYFLSLQLLFHWFRLLFIYGTLFSTKKTSVLGSSFVVYFAFLRSSTSSIWTHVYITFFVSSVENKYVYVQVLPYSITLWTMFYLI